MAELTDEHLADILRAVNAPCERRLPDRWRCGECETCRRRVTKSTDSVPVVIAALTSARNEIDRLRKALGLKDGDRLIEGHNGEYLAETCSGQRYRVNMLHAEMDELQRLRSEIEHLRDHPEFDCTDAAHPAWWRGQDHAVWVMCQLVADLLDGKEPSGVCNEPWETVRQRIAALMKQSADYHDRPTGPGRWVCMSKPWADGKMNDVVLDLSQDDLDRGAPFHADRVYGPLPVDAKGQS